MICTACGQRITWGTLQTRWVPGPGISKDPIHYRTGTCGCGPGVHYAEEKLEEEEDK